jgi:hypothetical protein
MNITIPINRKRFPHVLVIGSLFIVYLIYVAYNKAKETPVGEYFRWAVYVPIMIVLLYFVVLAFIEYFKTLFDRNASMKITDISIIDNLSIFSCGKILWDEITDVQVIKTPFAEFLIIKVQDPFKYLKDKNPISRRVLKSYIKKFGSPIVISDQRVNYSLHQLKELILERN